MTKIGLSNIQFSSDGEIWKPLGVSQEFELKIEKQNDDFYDFIKDIDINKNIEFSCNIHKKRHGNIFEKCLYYQNHKKKRIRKKYFDKLHYLFIR